VQIAIHMWAGDESHSREGTHRLARPVRVPRPLHRPRPPILIGGHGERRTLRLVAQYADACNLFDIPDGGQTVRRKLAVLARRCEELGRAYGEIEKTLSTRLQDGESGEEFACRCTVAATWGIEHVVVVRSRAWSAQALGTLPEVIPQVREVEPSR
jgi:alkanesulfonate monooxygenase SsuD/methylene tetrahydromethanopterin reductase-like flavin-dependent oxidoreductase (luciferase family)